MSRAMKFPAWESQGGSGCRRSAGKDSRYSEVPSSPIGGGRPHTLTAADWGFYVLCLLIFACAPLAMVLW